MWIVVSLLSVALALVCSWRAAAIHAQGGRAYAFVRPVDFDDVALELASRASRGGVS